MSFWNFVKNQDTQEIELRIDGDIVMDDDFWSWLFPDSTVTPKGFMAELAKHRGQNLTVWINSYGGDVYAASRIYTALMEHKGDVTVKIDGVAISAASVIAMAGRKVYMSPTSIMMVHKPWMAAQGDANDLRHGADILDEVQETIINAYQLKTGRSRAKIAQLMDQETWMGAKMALAEGFIDGMLYSEGQPNEAQNSLGFSYATIQNNAAESTRRFIEQYNQRRAAAEPPQEPEEKRQAPLDLYDKLNKTHERRLTHEI